MKKQASLSGNNRSGNDHGSVLLICLFILALMSIFGMIALNATDTELKAAGKRKAALQSFFAAESGISEAMRRLKVTASSSDYMGETAAPLDPDWSAYILTTDSWATSDDPSYDGGLSNYIPTSSSFTNTTIQANSKQSDISYFVRIRHKREYDAEQAGHTTSYPHYFDDDAITTANSNASRGGIVYYGYGDPFQATKAMQFTTSNATQHYPVEIITTYGMSGNGFNVTEAEVVRNPGIAVLAAIYSEGDFTGNGNSATISGVDNCGKVSDLPAIYTLDPATTSVSGATVDGVIANGTDDLDLDNYLAILKDATSSQITLTADVNGDNYGNTGDFVTVYSETSGNVGGLKMSNINGYGNLIIEGDLTLGGGFTWTGLVVVTGTITFNGGGSGVNIIGAVMSGDTVTLNGGLEIYYDSCAVGDALNSLGYELINWRQL
ncbi:MAG: hypothetical protein DRH08_04910 [Deltaproteobacteria bacterium]|nr:MAG: hypothetical protein DRH08_04910 [Deltaproteobacteria bacterium]